MSRDNVARYGRARPMPVQGVIVNTDRLDAILDLLEKFVKENWLEGYRAGAEDGWRNHKIMAAKERGPK